MGFGHVDYIVTSKRVFTSAVGDDAARPLAFAVVGDRIEFMGTPADVIAACAPGTPVLDFGDAFICPGFHDAHLHFFHTALGASPYLLMHMGESEAELVAHRRVRRWAAQSRLGGHAGLARLPLGPARTAHQALARRGVSHPPVRYVLG